MGGTADRTANTWYPTCYPHAQDALDIISTTSHWRHTVSRNPPFFLSLSRSHIIKVIRAVIMPIMPDVPPTLAETRLRGRDAGVPSRRHCIFKPVQHGYRVLAWSSPDDGEMARPLLL